MTLLPTSVSMAKALKLDPASGATLTHQPVPLTDTITVILADNEGHYTGPGTNTYLVGKDRLWIIDPGPKSHSHVEAVLKSVAGRPVDGVLVTHSQLDHSPAATLLQETLDAPIYGFGPLPRDLIGKTDEDIDIDFRPDICLADGERLKNAEGSVTALHTPGHYPNHMAYALDGSDILFSGDHVMGWATTVVVPPLGNLPDYLESLKRIEAYGARVFLPSHGPVIPDAKDRCRALREHRLARHHQIKDCLDKGVTEPEAIVSAIYPDLPSRLIEAAMGQVTAHLECCSDVADLCSFPKGCAV